MQRSKIKCLSILLTMLYFSSIQADCLRTSQNLEQETNVLKNVSRDGRGYGPFVQKLNMDPKFETCKTNTEWQTEQVLKAADYWVSKKLNYCHHHNPYWFPYPKNRTKESCSHRENISSHSVDPSYADKLVRWNYSGKGKETIKEWHRFGMWHGVDCSDFTALIYNTALNVDFTTGIYFQAGQSDNNFYNLSDGIVNPDAIREKVISRHQAPGDLVCLDGSVDKNNQCKIKAKSGDNNSYYFSALPKGYKGYASLGKDKLKSIPLRELPLENLKPGDLLFIADDKDSAKVTHVVMWTGEKIGQSKNIPIDKIAPNGLCRKSWYPPKNGSWIIVDSTYQGPDYREFSECFYGEHLWGVRRIIKSNN